MKNKLKTKQLEPGKSSAQAIISAAGEVEIGRIAVQS
jgi:hypothetical protein